VLLAALRQAGTTVLEPVVELDLELAPQDLGAVLAALGELDARPGVPTIDGPTCALHGVMRTADLHLLRARLPDLTRGEGVLETSFGGYQPVQGPPPSRPRTDRNPLDRTDYLRRVNHGA